MAEQESCKDIQLLKRTKISVFVDEALPDILVVTYEFGVKIFKGVLLDSTKKNLPCGIQTLNPAFKPTKPKPEDDSLYAVNQRFAYTDPSTSKKRNVQISSKYKNSKMTVRLRPRQVLCSKCKGICNENSENVSRKRKPSTENSAGASSLPQAHLPPVKRGLNAPITRSVSVHHANVELSNKRKLGEASLVPKLTRLTPQEEMSATNGGTFKIFGEKFKKPTAVANKENNAHEEKKSSSEQSEDSSNSDDVQETVLSANGVGTRSGKRVLRKKRSVGSMEDLWDESVFEENGNKNLQQTEEQNPNHPINTTKTIKISYGPQGEGTVLKIPAQQISDNLGCVNLNTKKEEDKKITEDVGETEDVGIRNRAARKALKKAKKEARRKVFLATTGSSPMYLTGGSPRYTVGSASPRHGLGNNSPRYMCTASYELSLPRRRKHKVKHKKRHKEDKDRKHKEGEVSSTQDESKEQCLTQKLSINLKRLNNTYATYPTTTSTQPTTHNEENTSSSDEHSEQQVPDFPPPTPPLMLRINSQTLSSAPTADGGRMLVGDVVWGKIHGFPWWPGKVLTITNCGGQGPPQAHVAWYGSSTSSLMQCDQLSPYLENFKIRYNKKKRGPYKEAIKQATLEAKENAQQRMRQPLGNSPSHNIIPQVVPPALASPREIDVVS